MDLFAVRANCDLFVYVLPLPDPIMTTLDVLSLN